MGRSVRPRQVAPERRVLFRKRPLQASSREACASACDDPQPRQRALGVMWAPARPYLYQPPTGRLRLGRRRPLLHPQVTADVFFLGPEGVVCHDERWCKVPDPVRQHSRQGAWRDRADQCRSRAAFSKLRCAAPDGWHMGLPSTNAERIVAPLHPAPHPQPPSPSRRFRASQSPGGFPRHGRGDVRGRGLPALL